MIHENSMKVYGKLLESVKKIKWKCKENATEEIHENFRKISWTC